MFCVYFLLSENKLSASTAEMFEVVGRFLKCFGLLSQVGWFICEKHTMVDVFFFEHIAKSDNPNKNFTRDQTKQNSNYTGRIPFGLFKVPRSFLRLWCP